MMRMAGTFTCVFVLISFLCLFQVATAQNVAYKLSPCVSTYNRSCHAYLCGNTHLFVSYRFFAILPNNTDLIRTSELYFSFVAIAGQVPTHGEITFNLTSDFMKGSLNFTIYHGDGSVYLNSSYQLDLDVNETNINPVEKCLYSPSYQQLRPNGLYSSPDSSRTFNLYGCQNETKKLTGEIYTTYSINYLGVQQTFKIFASVTGVIGNNGSFIYGYTHVYSAECTPPLLTFDDIFFIMAISYDGSIIGYTIIKDPVDKTLTPAFIFLSANSTNTTAQDCAQSPEYRQFCIKSSTTVITPSTTRASTVATVTTVATTGASTTGAVSTGATNATTGASANTTSTLPTIVVITETTSLSVRIALSIISIIVMFFL